MSKHTHSIIQKVLTDAADGNEDLELDAAVKGIFRTREIRF